MMYENGANNYSYFCKGYTNPFQDFSDIFDIKEKFEKLNSDKMNIKFNDNILPYCKIKSLETLYNFLKKLSKGKEIKSVISFAQRIITLNEINHISLISYQDITREYGYLPNMNIYYSEFDIIIFYLKDSSFLYYLVNKNEWGIKNTISNNTKSEAISIEIKLSSKVIADTLYDSYMAPAKYLPFDIEIISKHELREQVPYKVFVKFVDMADKLRKGKNIKLCDNGKIMRKSNFKDFSLYLLKYKGKIKFLLRDKKGIFSRYVLLSDEGTLQLLSYNTLSKDKDKIFAKIDLG